MLVRTVFLTLVFKYQTKSTKRSSAKAGLFFVPKDTFHIYSGHNSDILIKKLKNFIRKEKTNMSIKRKLAGTLVSSMILTSLSVVPVFADTKGDEKTSSVVSTPSVPGFDLEYVEDEDTGSYIKRVWNVTDYNGSGKTAAITDLSEFDGFENEESGTYVRNVINLDSSDIFDPSDEIESLSIDDTSISKLSGNVFSNLRNLKEFTTDPGNKHFTAKDGLLY